MAHPAAAPSIAFAYWCRGVLASLKCTPKSLVASALLYTVLGCPAGSFPLSINETSDTR